MESWLWLLVAGCWNKGNQNIQIIFNDEKSLIGTETKRAEVVFRKSKKSIIPNSFQNHSLHLLHENPCYRRRKRTFKIYS